MNFSYFVQFLLCSCHKFEKIQSQFIGFAFQYIVVLKATLMIVTLEIGAVTGL